MANEHMNLDRGETDNHEIGRELYNKDKQQDQYSSQRYRNRNDSNRTRDWGENNFFHTGPNPRGAQDRDRDLDRNRSDYGRGGVSNSSYNQGQNAHLSDHYGSRTDSPYRNERSFINHGDRGNSYQHDERHSMRRPHSPGGSLQGNHSDQHSSYQNDPWREGPGSGSRYKESDYRYGSGSHNWYRENRYSPNSDDERRRHRHDNRGFMDRVKDTWNDIWHSDDEDYNHRDKHQYQSNSERLDSRKRYGSEQYRDRNFDRGFEGGPRWADESDSGQDNYYNDRDNTNRYRR